MELELTHPSEAPVFLAFGPVVAVVPSWMASLPRRGRGTIVVAGAGIKPKNLVEVEWVEFERVGRCARYRNCNYSESRPKTHGWILWLT